MNKLLPSHIIPPATKHLEGIELSGFLSSEPLKNIRLRTYSGHEHVSYVPLHMHTQHRCLNSLVHNKGITFQSK